MDLADPFRVQWKTLVYTLLEEGGHTPQQATLIGHSLEKSALSIKVLLNPVHVDGFFIHW